MNVVEVHIGEIKFGKDSEILQTLLGSCLGIAFINQQTKEYGLAHCLLPLRPHYEFHLGAKYVDQAILSMMNIFKVNANNAHQFEVYLSGGGNIIKELNASLGNKNIEIARRILSLNYLEYTELIIGDNHPQYMYLNCKTGKVTAQKIA
jgi:chemotaxis protein CheD